MTSQLDIFGTAEKPEPGHRFPAGFSYGAELITSAEEAELLAQIETLPFRRFEFHGYTGKRRVVSFGWH